MRAGVPRDPGIELHRRACSQPLFVLIEWCARRETREERPGIRPFVQTRPEERIGRPGPALEPRHRHEVAILELRPETRPFCFAGGQRHAEVHQWKPPAHARQPVPAEQ